MSEIRFNNENELMENILQSKAYQEFKDKYLPPKIEREMKAWKILTEHKGHVTEEILNQVFDTVDLYENKRWFGALLAKPNRDLIFKTEPEKLNQWLEQLLYANNEPDVALNTCLNTLQIKGASKGLATLLLYLSGPDKYGIWVNTTQKGLSILNRIGALKGNDWGKNYVELNNAIKEFQIQYAFQPHEIDWILFFIADNFERDDKGYVKHENTLKRPDTIESIEDDVDLAGRFTWVETYKEIANKLKEYKDKQQELINILADMQRRGLPTVSLMDTDADGGQIPLSVIDPFTFFANFNRGIKDKARIDIITILKETWSLSSDVPSDFSGIPLVNNMQSWFIAFKKDRGDQDVDLLWKLFIQALDNNIDEETFNNVLKLKYIGNKLTMGLFWIDPERYLNLDNVNRSYLAQKGITITGRLDFQKYNECLIKTKELGAKSFYIISYYAWLNAGEQVKYWLFAPGPKGEYWEEFYSKGIMAIGWDYLGDLTQYPLKRDIASAMREYDKEPDASKRNNANSCFSFCNDMKQGDYVIAKIGTNKIVGLGVITSDYSFDDARSIYKHVREIEWKTKGDWTVSDDNKLPLKTVTDITKYPKFVQYLTALMDDKPLIEPKKTEVDTAIQYWWLNANPKIWDINAFSIGMTQTYTSHNTQGNKRRIYQYFKQVKPGDILLGYVASPIRQIVALCEVTKGLHTTEEGEVFEFKKTTQLPIPIPLTDLKSIPDLEKCEPIINNQGSLFKLKPDEYEIIRSIIDDVNETDLAKDKLMPIYSIENCIEATGFTKERILNWKSAIERKKQAVFFGPPGTGKTFIADHIARHMVGGTDGIIDFIQFHPAYTYEEFMQGIRPDTDEKGNLLFNMKQGRFMEFCIRAQQRKGSCVLIIDEINRANIPRVFGELMYLLEYRDKDISLAGGTRFSIPKNVFIIGTMNTADRSIALVDFALRRRFAFLELYPEYDVLEAFQSKKGFNAKGLIQVLRDVNAKINNKDYSLGISFFMVEQLTKKLEQIWKMEIETYLEEFFFSQPVELTNFRWDKIEGKILS